MRLTRNVDRPQTTRSGKEYGRNKSHDAIAKSSGVTNRGRAVRQTCAATAAEPACCINKLDGATFTTQWWNMPGTLFKTCEEVNCDPVKQTIVAFPRQDGGTGRCNTDAEVRYINEQTALCAQSTGDPAVSVWRSLQRYEYNRQTLGSRDSAIIGPLSNPNPLPGCGPVDIRKAPTPAPTLPTAAIASAATGALATAATYLLPTPTATIAAGSSGALATGLGVGIGSGAAAVVVAGASYGAYKVAQWWTADPPATLGLSTIEDAVQLSKVLQNSAV